jgi:hypothetical protein
MPLLLNINNRGTDAANLITEQLLFPLSNRASFEILKFFPAGAPALTIFCGNRNNGGRKGTQRTKIRWGYIHCNTTEVKGKPGKTISLGSARLVRRGFKT